MNLVVLHGPPGIGKETIGTIVAARTGFRRLSAHDLAAPFAAVLGWGTPSFYEVRDQVQPIVISAALREPVEGVVLTYIFEESVNLDHFRSYASEARAVFVGLTCDIDEHARRASSEGRRDRSKWTDPDALRAMMARGDFDLPTDLPGEVHVLDTTGRTPDDVATAIVSLL